MMDSPLTTVKAESTVLDMVCTRIRACGTTTDGEARPSAIIWTDPQKQWLPAIEILRIALPELLELGSYAPEIRRGPAIWIRCVVDRTVPMDGITEVMTPIVYLPGVSRQDLRAGEDCPEELRPILELLYRGTCWIHQGGHDPTVSAFLRSPNSLGLELAGDASTSRALLNAVREVLATPIASLQGRHLDAAAFNQLVAGDVIRDLLQWMSSPSARKQAMTKEQWIAFTSTLKSEFKFDPDVDGPLTAAERMCKREGLWSKIWTRFEEAPNRYEQMLDLLVRVDAPDRGLFDPKDVTHYVAANDEAELALENTIAGLHELPPAKAAEALIQLDIEHGARRKSVWARLGRARFATALEPLAALARGVLRPIGGVTPSSFIEPYESFGWKTDLAMLDALAPLDGPRDAAIEKVVNHLAEPWLDAGACAFQDAVRLHGLPGSADAVNVTPEPGCCVLFVDGLRYDLGRVLGNMLEQTGCAVEMRARWAALPTVTATAKPAVSPVADGIVGQAFDESFAPRFSSTNKSVDASGLRAAITARGGQVLGDGDLLTPISAEAFAWRETGELDAMGHKFQGRLAEFARAETKKVADAIIALFDAGWRSVRVVTDHGWLLLSKGMPKVDLPKHLAATKWSRCALLQGAAPPGIVVLPWHWNPQYSAATPPGIACFTVNQEYAHGGVSIQECLIPDITVTRTGGFGPVAQPRLVSVTWAKYRCVVETKNALPAMRIDIRIESTHGKSVLPTPKQLDDDGSVSIPVEDEHEKKLLVVVLLDAQGVVMGQRKTRIGEKT